MPGSRFFPLFLILISIFGYLESNGLAMGEGCESEFSLPLERRHEVLKPGQTLFAGSGFGEILKRYSETFSRLGFFKDGSGIRVPIASAYTLLAHRFNDQAFGFEEVEGQVSEENYAYLLSQRRVALARGGEIKNHDYFVHSFVFALFEDPLLSFLEMYFTATFLLREDPLLQEIVKEDTDWLIGEGIHYVDFITANFSELMREQPIDEAQKVKEEWVEMIFDSFKEFPFEQGLDAAMAFDIVLYRRALSHFQRERLDLLRQQWERRFEGRKPLVGERELKEAIRRTLFRLIDQPVQ